MKAKLFLLFSITAFALASVFLDIFNYNPYKSDSWVFQSFYISLFFTIVGIAGISLFFIKTRISKSKNYNTVFASSVRQGVLVSLSVTILLILQSFSLLDWWVGGPLVITVILLELFFQTIKKPQKIN